jgi:hypothetical protein
METPIGDDEDSHLGDFIEDQTVHSPVDSATSQGLKETTHSVLAGLTPREAKVLRMRFGIDMNTDHTLEEVGKQFDVTRERIRQIEAKATPASDTIGPASKLPDRRLKKSRASPGFFLLICMDALGVPSISRQIALRIVNLFVAVRAQQLTFLRLCENDVPGPI